MHKTVLQYQLFNTLQFGHCALIKEHCDRKTVWQKRQRVQGSSFKDGQHKHFAGKPCDCKGGWKVLSARRHDALVRSSAVMFIRRRHFILPRLATCKGKCSGLLQLEWERLGRFWVKPLSEATEMYLSNLFVTLLKSCNSLACTYNTS